MEDSGTTTVNPSLPPSPPRRCVAAEGYEACFYPGFVRRLALVAPDGRETVMYEQQSPFVLPPGQLKPWPASTLELRGNGRNVMVQLHDPGQGVDRVEILLKADPTRGAERLVIDNGPVLCPPVCPDPTSPG